jgi:predicted N-acetyltransferase YhbS
MKEETMTVQTETETSATFDLRQATTSDVESCGRIFYAAFESIAGQHGFPVEPSSPEFTRFKTAEMLGHEGFVAFVAEREGEVIGSVFVDQRSIVAGIGPVTVDPDTQDDGVGRALVERALDAARSRGVVGVRLVQTAYHYRSLALYAKLGFAVREPLSVLHGTPPAITVVGHDVRVAVESDLDACGDVCRRVHGHDRNRELLDAIRAGTAIVVERPDAISGYATGFGYGWHAVADSNDDMIALLGSAETFMGLGVLVPSRNSELMRWGLGNGLRIVQQSTLMTTGLYNEPAGAYLPSILF